MRTSKPGRRRDSVALKRLACAAALGLVLAPAAIAQVQTFAFDIRSQPMSSALLTFGRQAGLSVLTPSALVDGKVAPDVRGQLSATAALDLLLAGSGLKYEFVQANAVRITAADQATAPVDFLPAEDAFLPAERVTVTGTNIRGIYPGSSPVDIYTAQDIERTGATTTEQFVAKLPQNLATLSQSAGGSVRGSPNLDGVSAVDLRGLGVGTTLTLLNGHRMAPSNSGQSVDVSFIPASAIERVEVLTDGASAIYGSDAIGGVINFVLRDDFDGAETRLSYGGVSDGGMRQGDFSQAFGRSWQGGHGLVSYNYHSASALRVEDRSYASAAGPGNLSPTEERHNVFSTLNQALTDRLDLKVDVAAGRRDVKNKYTSRFNVAVQNHASNTFWSQSDQALGSIALDYRVSSSLNAMLSASYSEVDIDGRRNTFRFNRVPPQTVVTDFSTNSSALDVMAKLDGRLFSLPAGDVRFSAGGGVLEEEFRGFRPFSQVQSAGSMGRRSPYAFVEIFAPLVGPEQEFPLLRRLELSLAGRYTDYADQSSPPLGRDFGDSSDPKLGVLWSPFETLTLRGTYGTSFRAPSLTEIDPTASGHALQAFAVAGSPGLVLSLGTYAIPDLGPEQAETFTAGFDITDALPGFRMSGTYYNIDYSDRIGSAPSGGVNFFATPSLVPDLIYKPPSAAFIEEQLLATALLLNSTSVDLGNAQAAAVTLFAHPNFWIVDNRLRNLATSRQDGVDISVRQNLSLAWADIAVGANATHIISYRQQTTPTSTVFSAVGVPGRPPKWRGRGFVRLRADAYDATLNVNYTDEFTNVWTPGAPPVDSWTTVDLNLAYTFGGKPDGDTRLTLSIQNLLNQDPPSQDVGVGGVLLFPVGFDPTNANPLGRFVVVGLSKKW